MEKILRDGKTIVIFSGTESELTQFFNAFPSISDLVPYQHLSIPRPTKPELLEIFGMMAKSRGQIIQEVFVLLYTSNALTHIHTHTLPKDQSTENVAQPSSLFFLVSFYC